MWNLKLSFACLTFSRTLLSFEKIKNLSLYFFFSLCLSVFFPSIYVTLSVSLTHTFSLYIPYPLSISLSVSLTQSFSLSSSLTHSFSLTIPLSFCLSHSLIFALSLSLSLNFPVFQEKCFDSSQYLSKSLTFHVKICQAFRFSILLWTNGIGNCKRKKKVYFEN